MADDHRGYKIKSDSSAKTLRFLSRRSALICCASLIAFITIQNSHSKALSMKLLTSIEFLTHATIRIECFNNGKLVSSGTGFFYALFQFEDHSVPVIVTNKHVLNGYDRATFVLTLARADGSPDIGNIERVEILDLVQNWIGHPDPNVDLAIIPVANILRNLSDRNERAFFTQFDQSIIPIPDILKTLTPVEDVLVVGYPDGIWDSTNNFPIFRRGITASAPYVNFNGQSNFLIDCSIFPGSSGSPVVLYNAGSYSDGAGGLAIGHRFYFLGVVHSVALHQVTGQIIFVPAPTDSKPIPLSAMPNNLGICVMASRVLDFEPILVRSGLVALPLGYVMRSAWPNKI